MFSRYHKTSHLDSQQGVEFNALYLIIGFDLDLHFTKHQIQDGGICRLQINRS